MILIFNHFIVSWSMQNRKMIESFTSVCAGMRIFQSMLWLIILCLIYSCINMHFSCFSCFGIIFALIALNKPFPNPMIKYTIKLKTHRSSELDRKPCFFCLCVGFVFCFLTESHADASFKGGYCRHLVEAFNELKVKKYLLIIILTLQFFCQN